MTSVNDMPPVANQKQIGATNASNFIDGNSQLPQLLTASSPSATSMLGLPDTEHTLETAAMAAAIAGISNALQTTQKSSVSSQLQSIGSDKWHQSEEELLSKLQKICDLAKSTQLSAGDRALLIDAFDQVSTFAARSSNALCVEPLVDGAQTGYWEVEIPNYSFLQQRLGQNAVTVDSNMQKITQTAEEIRSLLTISGGITFSQVSGDSSPKTSPKRSSSPVTFHEQIHPAFQGVDFSKNFFTVKIALLELLQSTAPQYKARKLYDGLIEYFAYPNRAVSDLVNAYQFLHEIAPKNSQKYSEAYKMLLNGLWTAYATSCSAVKEAVASFDLEELMQQSILHKDFKLLLINGFEEPAQKSSLINYFITEKSPQDLTTLLDSALKPYINTPDEERMLPIDKAIGTKALLQLAILLDNGATVGVAQKLTIRALLHSVSAETMTLPIRQRLESYLS